MNLMRNCLILRNNEVLIHQKQLRILATKVFESIADMNPDFMKSYFIIKGIPCCLLLDALIRGNTVFDFITFIDTF